MEVTFGSSVWVTLTKLPLVNKFSSVVDNSILLIVNGIGSLAAVTIFCWTFSTIENFLTEFTISFNSVCTLSKTLATSLPGGNKLLIAKFKGLQKS